jgi:hypothetical protein
VVIHSPRIVQKTVWRHVLSKHWCASPSKTGSCPRTRSHHQSHHLQRSMPGQILAGSTLELPAIQGVPSCLQYKHLHAASLCESRAVERLNQS